jgi:glycosyltransferase involved in cell wall biosynthesis
MIHIKVATPMYQGECSGYFMESMLGLFNECSKRNIQLSWQFLYNESIIARGRNTLANSALNDGASHLLFIDADMRFNPEDIIRMLEADKDVIAAVCPKKEINWTTVKQAAISGEEELIRRTGIYNFVPLELNTDITISQYEPLEVARIGTGIMMIKRSVLESLKLEVRTFKAQDGTDIFEYFRMDIDDNGVFTGEDYFFCDLYRKTGGKVFAAPWTTVGHHGPMLYQGTLF